MPVQASGNVQIFYEMIPGGPPWQNRTPIFLHHGLALSHIHWYAWLPALVATGRSILRLDMRGHGQSTSPPEGTPWTIEDLAADALAVLDAAGVKTCHFVGESAGGTLGMYLAARYPDRITSVTAISAAYRGDRVGNLDEWDTLLPQLGIAGWSRMMMDRRFDPATIDPALAVWYEVEQAKVTVRTVLEIKNLLQRTNLTDDLPRIDRPVLLITPEASPFVGTGLMEDAHALIPRSELINVRGARHGLFTSHAAECADAFVNFLRRRGD